MDKTQIFVVHAHSGRFNGHAYVRANNVRDAKKIMRESDWLENGAVDNAQLYGKYAQEMELDSEEEKEVLDKLTKRGDWEEIEWGT